MNITAAKMSGEEILAKYPILNTKWKYSNYKDWSTEVVTDPWFRELKSNDPIKTTELQTIFSTTVEGNKVILVIYLKTNV